MRQKIIPCIWLESRAREAAAWYTGIFPESACEYEAVLPDTPGGEAVILTVNLWGSRIQLLEAGPMFERNPSFSYMVACATCEQAEQLWQALSDGGRAQVRMPFDRYPFCEKYGWLTDRFGISWQVMHDGGQAVQRITPALLFTDEIGGQAEEAMNSYCALLRQRGIDAGGMEGHLQYTAPAQAVGKAGLLATGRFRLAGREIMVMDSAVMDSTVKHEFTFNPMQSFIIYCTDQAEVDYFWRNLSADAASEQCGWLKDRFGVSWQIIPEVMEDMMANGSREQIARLVQSFVSMKKLDIAEMEAAYRGEINIGEII